MGLTEERDRDISPDRELLPVLAQVHPGVIDVAVARIENRAVLVFLAVATHLLDDGQPEHRRVLLLAFAFRADGVRLLARLLRHLDEPALVKAVDLGEVEPGAEFPVVVDLLPEADDRIVGALGCGALRRERRADQKESEGQAFHRECPWHAGTTPSLGRNAAI